MSDIYLQTQSVLTAKERETFLKNFGEANPHWRGAHVADVLAELANADANLDLVEPMYENHPVKGLATFIHAIFWTHGRDAVTWERVHELMERLT